MEGPGASVTPESDFVVTTKMCSIRIQRAAGGKRAPLRSTCGGPCRQARRHSVTQRGEKSLQRERMRLRRVLANPRVLELSTSDTMRLQLLGFDTHSLCFHLSPSRRFRSLWILMQSWSRLCSNSRMVFFTVFSRSLFNTGLAGQCTPPTGL